MNHLPHLVSVPAAAKQANVARNTILLAAKSGKIKSVRIGRDWFIYADDIERWKLDDYQPAKARKQVVTSGEDDRN
jgi:excisionase family DNA binding protein